jgi:hypothetical protein
MGTFEPLTPNQLEQASRLMSTGNRAGKRTAAGLFDALARRESLMQTPTTEPKTVDAKPWWMSKTIAVQVGTVAVAVLSAVTDVVPKTWLPYILTAVAAINIGLRTITTKSLTLRGGRR